MKKLLILGRDGTLNVDRHEYFLDPRDWVPMPGAMAAIARLNRAGWRVVLASNQPGLGSGAFDMGTLNAVHQRMHELMRGAGARIEAVFFCPHRPDEGCACRKPAPGLLLDICRRYGLPPSEVVVAADAPQDMAAALAAGCQAHLVLPGSLLARFRELSEDATLVPGGLGTSGLGGVPCHGDLLGLCQALLGIPDDAEPPFGAQGAGAPLDNAHTPVPAGRA